MKPPKPPAKRAFVGVAGSPLAKSAKPEPQRQVLLHFCSRYALSSFEAFKHVKEVVGQKSETCACKMCVPLNQAMDLVDRKCADWLLTRAGRQNTRAVVIRKAIVGGEVIYAVNPSVKPDKGSEKHDRLKQEIRDDVIKILQQLLGKGVISQEFFKVNSENLDDVFQNPDELLKKLTELNQDRLRKQMTAVILHWWNVVLGYQSLGVTQGAFVADAPRGAGKITVLDNAESVDAAHRRFAQLTYEFRKHASTTPDDPHSDFWVDNCGREVNGGSGHRASFWGGAWDYSTGTDPVKFLLENTDDEPDDEPEGSWDAESDF